MEQVLELDPVAMPGAALKTDLLRWFRRRDREDAGVAAWVLAAVRHQVGVEDGYVDTIGWLSWQTGKPAVSCAGSCASRRCASCSLRHERHGAPVRCRLLPWR